MQFRTTKENMQTISNALHALSQDESMWKFEKSGLGIGGVDPSHTYMMILDMDKKGFEEYIFDQHYGTKGFPVELGVDCEKLDETVKAISSRSKVEFCHDDEMNQIVLKSDNLTRKMSLIDYSNMSKPHVPKLDLHCKFKMGKEELMRIISAAGDVADYLAMTAHPDRLVIEANGDTDSIEASYFKDMLEMYEVPADEAMPARSTYNLKSLKNIVHPFPAGTVLTVSFSNDYIVRIEGAFAGVHGKIMYLLGSRIE